MEQQNKAISIYHQIHGMIGEDGLPREFILEPAQGEKDSFRIPGHEDGLFIYYGRPHPASEELSRQVDEAFQKAAGACYTEAIDAFDRLAKKYRAIRLMESIQTYMIRHKQKLNLGRLYYFTVKYLLIESDRAECVKIGLEILEMFGEPAIEEVKQIVRDFGLYDEFTLYAVFNMCRWNDKNREIFQLAKKVEGWGRIHAIEQLEADSEEIREWLLYEGIYNQISPEYSAKSCFYKGQAYDIMKRGATRSEFTAISVILHYLMMEDAMLGITGISYAKEFLDDYLQAAASQILTFSECSLIEEIRRFALESIEYRAFVSRCDEILESFYFNRQMQGASEKNSGADSLEICADYEKSFG